MEDSNAVTIGVSARAGQVGKGVTTVDRSAVGGYQGKEDGARTASDTRDPRWRVESNIERWEETLDERRCQAMAVNGLIS